MIELLLLRHGQSTWNAEGRWQGWADAPLSALGEEQAREAAAHLDGLGLAAVAASTLQRARRTAELLAEALDLGPVDVVEELRERHVGSFTGLTRPEIQARWPDAFDPETGRLLRPPDGESDEQLLHRVLPALAELATRRQPGPVLVVTHGGVIRTLERHVDAEPPAATPNLGGRWFTWDGTAFAAGPPLVPIEPEVETAPKSL